MNIEIPNWVIIAGGIGQIFTALIYPYIRHKVFDWYTDVKKLKPLPIIPCIKFHKKLFLKLAAMA